MWPGNKEGEKRVFRSRGLGVEAEVEEKIVEKVLVTYLSLVVVKNYLVENSLKFLGIFK